MGALRAGHRGRVPRRPERSGGPGRGDGDIARPSPAGPRERRPVLLVTNHAPPYRVAAFAALHEAEGIEVALIGGRLRHGGLPVTEELPFPHRHVTERQVAALAGSGRFRAVIAGLSGRVALPAAWVGAHRARVPFVLWATMWAHPRTPAHLLSYLPLRHMYRHADAVATYGPHVTAYVRAKGARGPVIEAPQAADVAFWSDRDATVPDRRGPWVAVFVGRPDPEKGRDVLLDAWRLAGLDPARATLLLVGDPDGVPPGAPDGVVSAGRLDPPELRNILGGSDVLVVPSVPTATFLEPWGLVINEAMHSSLPVITSDAVGAAAGGLVRHNANGLIVPAADPVRLAAALRRLHGEERTSRRLGETASHDVASHTPAAWAAGMTHALAAAGASRSGQVDC